QIIMEREYFYARRRIGIVFANPAANKRYGDRIEGTIELVRAIRQWWQARARPINLGPLLVMEILRNFRELFPCKGRRQVSTVPALEGIAMLGVLKEILKIETEPRIAQKG